MNFEGQGKVPICKIYSEDDKLINLPIYLDEVAYNNNEGESEIKLADNMKIQHLPNNAVSSREIFYIACRYYSKKYIQEYKKKSTNQERSITSPISMILIKLLKT